MANSFISGAVARKAAWAVGEVIFVSAFSLLPLPITAINEALNSKTSASLSDQFYKLVYSGQLIYYALGFVATAAWLLLVDIRKPKWVVPALGLIIVFEVVTVGVTTDSDASRFNQDVFRAISYCGFGAALLTYLFVNVLKAFQPIESVESSNKTQANAFIARLKKERGAF